VRLSNIRPWPDYAKRYLRSASFHWLRSRQPFIPELESSGFSGSFYKSGRPINYSTSPTSALYKSGKYIAVNPHFLIGFESLSALKELKAKAGKHAYKYDETLNTLETPEVEITTPTEADFVQCIKALNSTLEY
jgi:hypothetical protein